MRVFALDASHSVSQIIIEDIGAQKFDDARFLEHDTRARSKVGNEDAYTTALQAITLEVTGRSGKVEELTW